MRKFVIILISAIVLTFNFDISAQTERNQTEGCPFRFVLESPIGTGWSPSFGINITVDGIDYGIVKLPWGTLSAEETVFLPSGEVQFFWKGGTSVASIHYFEIYNSFDKLIYTVPDMFPVGLLFTYQNECPDCIPLTDFEGEYIQETKLVNLNWTAPESENVTGFNILRNGELIDHVASTIHSYTSQTDTLATGDYKYCVVPVYPYVCNLDEKCFETYINNVRVKNFSSAFQVYPNPASNELHVQSSKFKVQNIEVFDIYGRKCHVSRVTRHENTIDISNLTNGIYFVKITTDEGIVVKKVIKQ